MKNMLRTAAVAAAGLLVLTLALTTDGARVAAQGMKPLLVQIMNTAAEPVPVVSSVDRVLLREQLAPTGICPTATHEVQRVLPDGTFGGSFIVPPGKKLVLTDLEAIIRAQPALAFPLGGQDRCIHRPYHPFACHQCAGTSECRRGIRRRHPGERASSDGRRHRF